MKQNACIQFLALALPLIVFWIDAANCLFCSERYTFSTVNICLRFNSRISINAGCMNLGKGVENAWNEYTCQYENYCDCEDNSRRNDGRKGEWKHGPLRCCELEKACRSNPCEEGEICRENVEREGFWCDKGCYNFETRGHDYRGQVKVTEHGRVCRRWDGLQSTGKKRPHFYTPDDERFEEYDLRENYCRNPSWRTTDEDNAAIRPWCYTDDIGAETYWEYCDIPSCEISAGCRGENLAVNGEATASSHLGVHTAAEAFAGPRKYWHSDNRMPQHIMYDFKEKAVVCRITFFSRQRGPNVQHDCPSDFVIQGSHDGVSSWELLKEVYGNVCAAGQKIEIVLDNEVDYRYYKIDVDAVQGRGRGQGRYVVLRDIQMFGALIEAKNQQRHQAWIERREKSKRMLRARTEKTGFNPSIRSNWLKLVKNV